MKVLLVHFENWELWIVKSCERMGFRMIGNSTLAQDVSKSIRIDFGSLLELPGAFKQEAMRNRLDSF